MRCIFFNFYGRCLEAKNGSCQRENLLKQITNKLPTEISHFDSSTLFCYLKSTSFIVITYWGKVF